MRARASSFTQRDIGLATTLLDEIDVAVIAADLDQSIIRWNTGAERLYGWTASQMVGRSVSEVIPELDVVAEGSARATLFREGCLEREYVSARRDGTTFPSYVRLRVIRDASGAAVAVAAVVLDVTARKTAERNLLSARNYLKAVTDSVGSGLFTLDIDGRFIYINPAAATLLGWSLEQLQGQRMPSAVYPGRPDGSPLTVGECPITRVCADGTPIRVDDDVFLRADGGELPVAYTATPFSTGEDIEGCVVVFEDITERKLREQRVERDLQKLGWVERIQDALRQDRFVLHSQPIIDLQTGREVQHELLIRMQHPVDGDHPSGLVGPAEFLPVAEEFGFMPEIDRWVIDQGAELAATGLAVELNISGRSINDPRLITFIRISLEQAGARPEDLVFEITETTLAEDQVAARHFVEQLRALGCQVALDDFGTGYGGFTYLKHLPIDYLKIDTDFVLDLCHNPASHNVVSAIVRLADGFGLKTVAEGVEDEETLLRLRDLGVDYAQGYYLGPPAPCRRDRLARI